METNSYFIDVAKEFSRRPVGRYRTNGSFTGEAFRQDVLLPLVVRLAESGDNQKITVDFTDVTMNGSSFLEEAFGGLVLEMVKLGLVGEFYNADHPEELIQIISKRRPSIANSVYTYMIDVLRK